MRSHRTSAIPDIQCKACKRCVVCRFSRRVEKILKSWASFELDDWCVRCGEVGEGAGLSHSFKRTHHPRGTFNALPHFCQSIVLAPRPLGAGLARNQSAVIGGTVRTRSAQIGDVRSFTRAARPWGAFVAHACFDCGCVCAG